jgi:hypothetical protein
MADKSKQHHLTLETENPNVTPGDVIATKVFQRGLNSAVLIADYIGGLYGKDVSLTDWMVGLNESVNTLQANDLSSVEAMLAGQMMALDAIFANLARQALNTNLMPQIETFTRLALKAQNQSRATAQTLAIIKNPKQTVFMKQANISNGPQQVNNNFSQQENSGQGSPSTSPKNFKTDKNELLNAHEEIDRLDTGKARPSSRDDQKMETVGEGYRPKNRKRQGTLIE